MTQRALLEKRNFASDVRRIEREGYSPMKSAWGEGPPGMVEGGLYGVPGALASTSLAAVPYVGPLALYSSMEASAYDEVRENMLRGGATDEVATSAGYELAPVLAVPLAALEKVQASAFLGKLPLFEKAFMRVADRLQSKLLRGGRGWSSAGWSRRRSREGRT
ncbi:hypothetical protein [Luteolibacter sp. Populi]|uniref:hypothetical protein n=1 Tax=Luteolibacter sp. Populi TaxID=3230487 RepID=UPI003466BEA9